jgi:hypothetical protein
VDPETVQKPLFPRTLRAEGVKRLCNNCIEDFFIVSQNLESAQTKLGNFQSPLCGEARATIICNSRYEEIIRC